MKIALATTTIRVPHALKAIRACDPDVMFFVTGDRATPDEAVVSFLDGIPGHAYYGYDWQNKLGYACSPLIGPNCIQRRNISTLEALKWGADIIVFWDDDNFPLTPFYFDVFKAILTRPFSGLQASDENTWFDVGQFLNPIAKHRGIPHGLFQQTKIDMVRDANIGVAAGVCLGNADVDAITRIEKHPIVHTVSEVLNGGVAIHPSVHTVFNSQNTAFVRELAPALFLMPGVGRMDDIYASQICQRVMREYGMQVHFGMPYTWQDRNPHNLFTDLRAEIDGYENVTKMATLLDSIMLVPDTVVNQCRRIHETLALAPWLPEIATQAAMAFLDDIEKII